MRSNQIIVVGGTISGKRVVSDALSANEAIDRFHLMRRQGYSLLTLTDAETGQDYDVGKFMAANPQGRQ